MTRVLLGDKLGLPHSESLDVNGFPDSIWKTIPDFPKGGSDSEYYRFEGRFQCDQYGNIRCKKIHKGKMASEYTRVYWWGKPGSTNVYACIRIHPSDGSTPNVSVHRIVMYTFNETPEEKELVCDHINGNTLDNRNTNLRWLYNSQNIARACGKPVTVIFPNGECKKYNTTTEAANDIGTSTTYIGRCFRNKVKCKGCVIIED